MDFFPLEVYIVLKTDREILGPEVSFRGNSVVSKLLVMCVTGWESGLILSLEAKQ